MLNSIKRARITSAPMRTAAMIVMIGSGLVTSTHARDTNKPARKATADWQNANASIGPARTFSGVASFYGNESGNKTASGQPFRQDAMTAAHRSLPFGTKLKVTHGNRSVVVTINDRGPFIKGRVLDLSTGAARVIGLTGRGVGHVVAEVQ